MLFKAGKYSPQFLRLCCSDWHAPSRILRLCVTSNVSNPEVMLIALDRFYKSSVFCIWGILAISSAFWTAFMLMSFLAPIQMCFFSRSISTKRMIFPSDGL